MTPFILNKQAATDTWTLIREATGEIAPNSIVPFALWQAQTALHGRADIGVWLENTTEPEQFDLDWNQFPVIALDYPKFTDGRSHSIAYVLRNRCGFTQQLRAIGEVLVDQLYYMSRVGFNAFSLREDQKIESALRGLNEIFSTSYQGSSDDARPFFARNAAELAVIAPIAHTHFTLSDKITATQTQLAHIAQHYSPARFASSLALEDMVLTDLIAKAQLPIEIFTLQTGMLHPETSQMVHTIAAHYGLTVTEFTPDESDVAQYVSEHGKHAFYESVELRKACCFIRKVKPLQRALAGQKAWITGQRREQSTTRTTLQAHEFDEANGLDKFNPLADWTFDDVKSYVAQNNVPYNPLHDKGYPSIGCEPCTRAIKAGEDVRAGRWWWESADSKECGLHIAEHGEHVTHEDKVD
ncbi:MAG: phosphoadenylyl-sulfate reductase [Formosimonas sp.]